MSADDRASLRSSLGNMRDWPWKRISSVSVRLAMLMLAGNLRRPLNCSSRKLASRFSQDSACSLEVEKRRATSSTWVAKLLQSLSNANRTLGRAAGILQAQNQGVERAHAVVQCRTGALSEDPFRIKASPRERELGGSLHQDAGPPNRRGCGDLGV